MKPKEQTGDHHDDQQQDRLLPGDVSVPRGQAANEYDRTDARLWLVTRLAQPAAGETPAAAQSPLWGFGRVLALEHVAPDRLFKTLVALVDGEPTVAIVPVDGNLDTKALARASGGKRAGLAPPDDAERLTGYVVGGVSPLGQRRRLPCFVDAEARRHATVFVSAGRRGLQVELAPDDLVRLTGATIADVADRGSA